MARDRITYTTSLANVGGIVLDAGSGYSLQRTESSSRPTRLFSKAENEGACVFDGRTIDLDYIYSNNGGASNVEENKPNQVVERLMSDANSNAYGLLEVNGYKTRARCLGVVGIDTEDYASGTYKLKLRFSLKDGVWYKLKQTYRLANNGSFYTDATPSEYVGSYVPIKSGRMALNFRGHIGNGRTFWLKYTDHNSIRTFNTWTLNLTSNSSVGCYTIPDVTLEYYNGASATELITSTGNLFYISDFVFRESDLLAYRLTGTGVFYPDSSFETTDNGYLIVELYDIREAPPWQTIWD